MARPAFALLALAACTAGCSVREGPRSSGSEAAIRVLSAGSPGRVTIVRSVIGRPLAPDGLLESGPWRRGLNGPGCHPHRLDPRVTFADGKRVLAEDVIAAWESALLAGEEARWLLAPVLGVAAYVEGVAPSVTGLRVETEAFVVCVDRAVPDWVERLGHPELWVVEARDGRSSAPGPFQLASGGALVARDVRPRSSGPTRIDILDGDEADLTALLRAGRIDLAIVAGHAIDELLGPPRGRAIEIVPAPGWSRSYALWLDAGARWLDDPRFRSWLRTAVDPASALDLLFGGRGRVVSSLVGTGGEAGAERPRERPLGGTSRPRIDLLVPADDADAVRLASRLEAVLDRAGVVLVQRPASTATYQHELAARACAASLLVHRPTLGDPVLDLTQTLWPVRDQAPETMALLEAGARRTGSRQRLDVARRAEAPLLERSHLVPLLALDAALARRTTLPIRIEPGRDGAVRLHPTRAVR